MHEIIVRVETLSPIIIPVTLGEANVVQTADYLAGSVLLGMFAAEYIKREKSYSQEVNVFHEDERFFNWFLAGYLKYTAAYPTDGDFMKPYLPCPLYLHQDKKDENALYNIMEPHQKETKHLGGYIKLNGSSIAKLLPEKKLRFHHRRDNRLAARSEDGSIFNYEALEAGQCFQSSILGSKDMLEEFYKYYSNEIEKTINSFTCRAGRSRNTQYGSVNVTLEKPVELLDRHLENSDKFLSDVYIVLESPLILYNDCGFPEVNTDVFKSYLQQELKTELEINNALTRIENIEKFVTIWRLKRPLDLAFQAGSTFSISFKRKTSSATMKRLRDLQFSGMGERTKEGYGRFRIETAISEYTLKKNKKIVEILEPKGVMPEQIKEAVKSIILTHITTAVETNAINDALEYARAAKKGLPSNSLLGRLELIANTVKTSESIGDEYKFNTLYAEKLQSLKSPAKEQLNRCWKGKSNLLNRLLNAEEQEKIIIELFDNILYRIELVELAERSGYDFRNDQGLANMLLKAYWLILFRQMRKLNREVNQDER